MDAHLFVRHIDVNMPTRQQQFPKESWTIWRFDFNVPERNRDPSSTVTSITASFEMVYLN